MKAKFLAAAFVLLAAPAFANTPAVNNFSAAPSAQLRLAPEQNARDSDPTLSLFNDRFRAYGAETRPLSGRHGSDLSPPHMDAGGVPNPRI
jgi:hypothetical protein